MPVWLWVVAGVLAPILYIRWKLLRRRAEVSTEFVYYLQEHHPRLRYLSERGGTMSLRHDERGPISVRMHRIWVEAFGARADRAARQAVYARFSAALDEMTAVGPDAIGPGDAARLRPRIVLRAMLDEQPALRDAPSRPLGETGLAIVCVLDSPNSVAYVTRALAGRLQLDADALHERALANLSATFAVSAVRAVLDRKALSLVKTLDGHDAARLLLVPGALAEGEEVGAVIPDSDTLGLLPVPGDGDWSKVEKLARAAAGKPLFDRPLRVTRAGIALV